jgi:hypothetical protein
MRDFKIINIGGTNGIGKSTRMNVLVDYMETTFGTKPFMYDITIGKDPKVLNKQVGFTSNGYLFIGAKTQAGGWVGWDRADFSSWTKRIALFKDVFENFPEIHTIIVEGYFNNRSAQGSPKSIREQISPEISNLHYVFLYDNINEYIERTNGRTGKDRGLEWAEKSPGWKDNEVFKRFSKVYTEESEGGDKCTVLNKDESKDYFVNELFNASHEIKEEKQENFEEW